MKEIKITPPDGYEIDKDNSTFEKIVFKEVKKELPKTWKELKYVNGYYTAAFSVHGGRQYIANDDNKNIFFSKEQAQASIALAQLSQLREVYRQGWKPDYNNNYQNKYIIDKYKEDYIIEVYNNYHYFLAFQFREIAQQFLENFKDLIEQASPLLFD